MNAGEELSKAIASRIECAETRRVKTADLKPHPHRDFFSFDPDGLKAFAENIRQYGLAQPPIVNREMYIISGHRRTLACRDYLQWEEIPVHVIDLPIEESLGLFVTSNTPTRTVTRKTRLAILRSLAPELMRKNRLTGKEIGYLAGMLAISPRALQKDLGHVRRETAESLSMEELVTLWEEKLKCPVRINVLSVAAGQFILQINGRRFKSESGPASFSDCLRDSLRQVRARRGERVRGRHGTGQELRAVRLAARLTQMRAAELLGVSQSYYCECEKGVYRAGPTLATQLQALLIDDIPELAEIYKPAPVEAVPETPIEKPTRQRKPRARRTAVNPKQRFVSRRKKATADR